MMRPTRKDRNGTPPQTRRRAGLMAAGLMAATVLGTVIGGGTASADVRVAGEYDTHAGCVADRAATIIVHPFTDFGPCVRAGDVNVPYHGYETFGKWYFYYI